MSINIGPFALPLEGVLALLSIGLFYVLAEFTAGVGERCDRDLKKSTARTSLFIIVIGLLTGRIAFVIQYKDDFLSAPWQVLNIRDGGILLPWSLLGAALVAIVFVVRNRDLLKPLTVGVMGAACLYLPASIFIDHYHQTQSLPDVNVFNLDGELINLRELSGQPVVINLWATWCPPCRREMPAFSAVQQSITGVKFVLLNQGEDITTITEYLKQQQMLTGNIYLDRQGEVAKLTESVGLPTTLFFNAKGTLVDSHMGELTAAGIRHKSLLILTGD